MGSWLLAWRSDSWEYLKDMTAYDLMIWAQTWATIVPDNYLLAIHYL